MNAGPQQIETEIARQRDQLAGTVDALSAKLDVKARAKDAATTSSGKPKPALLVPLVLIALATTGVLVWRRRH